MPIPRTAFCLFCDDVRQEIGNKTSYMGVYMTDMLFPSNPSPDATVMLPKFCISVWLITDITDKPQKAIVTVFVPPGRTEAIRFDYPIDQVDQALTHQNLMRDVRKYILQATLPFTPMVFASEGHIEVQIETEREILQAGKLRVVIPGRPDLSPNPSNDATSLPTASPPPSGQSPTDAPGTKPKPSPRRPSTRRSARTPETE